MVQTAALLFALPLANGIGLTWSDCGDADTHAKVTDLQPTTINLGKNSLKGTGTLDKDEDGGSFKFVAKTGPITTLKGSGDLCEDTTIDMPLGAGTVVFHALGCPVKAGNIEVDIDVNVLSEEAANALLNIHVTAETTSGDKLLCLDIGAQSLSSSPAAFTPYKTAHKKYTVKGMDKTSNKVDVWYPTGTSEQFPFISYSHGNTAGGTKTVSDYDVLLSTMASYGYIIAAHESCDTGCSDKATDLWDPPGFKNMYKEQLKVIDWAKDAGAGGDAVLSKVNFDIGVGIAGHSMGGQATMKSSSALGAGHGIKTAVMHHAYTHTYEASAVPFLAFTGAEDIIATPAQTQRFYNLDNANPIKGYVNKASATHFEPNSAGAAKLAVYSAAWFKVFLDETPQSGGVDFHEMIFGDGADSLCNGGDGSMTACEVHDGSPSPSPSPSPEPTPSPAPSPSSFTCDQCETQGYKKDVCNCGVCGSFGACTFTCTPGGGRVACDQGVSLV